MSYASWTFIHIPKTGGTAIKQLEWELQKKGLPLGFNMPKSHRVTLSTFRDHRPMFFVIRDPLDRYCSGFWEVIHHAQRQQIAAEQYPTMPKWGYGRLDQKEQEILKECSTPDELLTWTRRRGYLPCSPSRGLGQMLESITAWIGRLEDYQREEDRVIRAFDIKDLSRVIKVMSGHDLPADPFRARRQELFGDRKKDVISPENLDWFREHYRRRDYELIEYIRSRPYWGPPWV